MIDRENVIKGLECCLGDTRADLPNLCTICPYAHGSYATQTCGKKLREDALALLKAQKPRVMSIQEIHRGMVVWLEDIDKEDVILAIGGSSCGGAKCFITEKDVSVNALDVEYNTRWRAWTDEPTTAQREAVKWE